MDESLYVPEQRIHVPGLAESVWSIAYAAKHGGKLIDGPEGCRLPPMAGGAGNWVENIAKGRVVELFNRVDQNEPAGSIIVLVPLSTTTTVEEARDYANLETFLGGTANEQTLGGWARKLLTDSDIAAIAVDNANDRFPASLPEQKWTTPEAGKNTQGLAVCYDPKAAEGVETEIIVCTVHDFAVTADGNDVILAAGECFRAS